MNNNKTFKETFKRGMTHGGLCHSDEVLATALIRKFLSTDFPVDRVFSVPEGTPDDVLVYDIGGGQFDHHKGKKFSSHDETHELSSCGLIWEEFEGEFKAAMPEFAFNEISSLVKEIDKHDNGHKVSPVAIAMSNLKVPGSTPGPKDFDLAVQYMVELLNWASTPAPEQWDVDVQRIVDCVKSRIDSSIHKEDLKALYVEGSCMAHILAIQDYYISLDPQYPEDWDIVGDYIGNAEKHIQYKLDCVEAVKVAPRQETPIGNVIVLEKFIPVSPEGLKDGDVAYIAPSLRGGYNCTILTPPGKFYDYESSTVKFPRKDECVKDPTRFGLTFMHEKGFILGAETPEMIFNYLKYPVPVMALSQKIVK